MATNPVPLSTVNSKVLPKMQRQDTWWIQPLATFVVFVAFIIYVTFRTFENAYFEVGSYLSPLYSPHISTNWMIFGKHFSPAIFVLPVPLLFRSTCYYYRKAYYRAFFLDPPACAVTEVSYRHKYNGEKEFPLILQNIHRYGFYLAAIVMVVLWWDAILAFTTHDAAGALHFTVRLGSLIFLANVSLLSMYTFSCHSWRHLSGGCMNCFSCSAGAVKRHTLWQKISHLNENHALWAWCSLFSVALTDLYVRYLSMGAPIDFKIF